MCRFAKTTYVALVVLLVNEIRPLFSLRCSRSAIGTNNFQVYWNVPTAMCHQYGMNFSEVAHEFGMLQNYDDTFQGSEIVILYAPGMFPKIVKEANGAVFMKNGGVPQEGNLTTHLDLFEKYVLEHIPDVSFCGLAVIDFEYWRPVYRQNWAGLKDYRVMSEAIVKQKHPEWNAARVKQEARRQFERWGRIFMEESLKMAKALRPQAAWGYYFYPYCYNLTPGHRHEDCEPRARQENDNMPWLFTAQDAILPSVYLRKSLNIEGNRGLIRGRINEALRMANMSSPRKMVLPYIGYAYTGRQDLFLTREELVNGFQEIIDRGADGSVIWGSYSGLSSKEKCQKFRHYLAETLGPAVAGVIAMANQLKNSA